MTIFIMSTVLTTSLSCQARNQSNKATATHKEIVLDTNTAIPVKHSTTLTPTNTMIPTATQTPTSATTWTPLPTLSEEDKIDIIRILIETNGWCRFPCWWGITPGETTWQEAKQFLGTFSNKIIEYYQQELIDDAAYLIGYHDILVQVPNEGQETYIRFIEKDGVIVQIGVPQLYEESSFYPPNRILQEYGKPDEIFIHFHPHYGSDWKIALNLVYQEKSFEATYDSYAKT